MFETSFSYASATPLPAQVTIANATTLLHDFETIVRLSPDCRGCKPISPPPTKTKTNSFPANGGTLSNGQPPTAPTSYYEVEDDLPFIPKKFWSGGVRYTADFLPTADGCDITVHAPGGFTSTNHWRLLRENIPEDREAGLERVLSKDLLHAETSGDGWYVQIVSDARCNKTFAGFVKGFLKNSHSQLQLAFIERLKVMGLGDGQGRGRRPTMGRRRSTGF